MRKVISWFVCIVAGSSIYIWSAQLSWGKDALPIWYAYGLSIVGATLGSLASAARLLGLSKSCEMLSCLLGSKTRERVFEPAYNDLLAAHLTAQQGKCHTPQAIRHERLRFGCNLLVLLCGCALVGIRRLLLPRGLKKLWERIAGL